MDQNIKNALANFLLKTADDQLIIGHRNSEWTGLGPMLEEDIAFSSIAQDKVGHAYNLFQILNTELGFRDPDLEAFTRKESEMRCCHLVEYPIGEYDFSLMRHFLFDTAEQLRFNSLVTSNFMPLALLARKIKGEIKYHVFHANTFVKQLFTDGNEESKARMQSALNECFPLALGMFESYDGEELLVEAGMVTSEEVMRTIWYQHIYSLLSEWGYSVPVLNLESAVLGGRKGYHSEHLAPLLEEMNEVFSTDPTAKW